jgi:hypothetical protein
MPAKFSLFTVAALPLIPVALACGGGDDSGKIMIQPDAGMPDAPVVCTAAPSYPGVAAGSGTQAARNYPASGTGSSAMPRVVDYQGAINADIDVLRLLLFSGVGNFSGGDIKTGTFQLSGSESTFNTCGTCVFVLTDVTRTGFSDWYQADGGTLTITTAGAGAGDTIAGSLSNVTFRHVGKDADGLPTATTVDNCVTMIPSANFSAVMMAPPMMATGKREALLTHRWN